MNISEFKSEDYLRLKWHLMLLVVCLALVATAFFVVSSLDVKAARQLNIARGEMESAQTTLDQIEKEEATITEYIGRYQGIAAGGSITEKDRLYLLETVAQIRSRYNLFPVQLETHGEPAFTLPYDSSVYQPGQPVHLETSPVEISLPLLHEDDLVNFLGSLLASPQLLLPASCSLNATNSANPNYLRLGQHFNASCSFLWYTFTVMGANGEPL